MRVHFSVLLVATVVFLAIICGYAMERVGTSDTSDAAAQSLTVSLQSAWLLQRTTLVFGIYIAVAVIVIAHGLWRSKPK